MPRKPSSPIRRSTARGTKPCSSQARSSRMASLGRSRALHRTRDKALLLPSEAMRLDLALDEATDLRAQRFVLFAEVGRGEGDGLGAVHVITRTSSAPAPRPCRAP